MRYIIGIGTAYQIGKHLGIITQHLNMQNLIDFGGGAYGTIGQALKKGIKHPAAALEDLAVSFAIPGGHEIKGLVEGKGLSVKEKPEADPVVEEYRIERREELKEERKNSPSKQRAFDRAKQHREAEERRHAYRHQ
jgi:hypothetical protein